MNVYFDIETVPGQRPGLREEIAATIKPPGNISKPESIAKWEREEKPAAIEAAYRDTTFDGGEGQIVCIGWAIDNGQLRSASVDNFEPASAASVISRFFNALMAARSTHMTRAVFIGHNHIAFDIPFIWKRAMVHNIKPPMWFPRNPKPWSEVVEDTMLLWDAGQRKGGSMDRICRILGIPGKGDVKGSDVWPMAQRGEFEEISYYCMEDVERTRQMYARMTFGAV